MLAAILLAAGTASAPFPAVGTYRYAASMSGQRLGEWSVTVKPANDGTEVDENSSATFAGMQLTATASLVLGADLAPVSYTGSYRGPMQSSTVSVVLTPATATIAGGMGGATRTLALQANTRHFVVIEPALLAGLFALPAQLQAWGDAAVTWIAPVTGQAQTISRDSSSANPVRPSGVSPKDVAISMQGQIPFTIWYDSTTLVPDEVIVPSQNAVLIRERS